MGRVCDRFPADTSSESTALRLKAFESAYNLDYDEAVAALNRAIALDPSNLANQRALAGITWLQTLFRRGAVIIDFYVCGSFKPRVKMEKPPPDLAEQFETHAATVLELSEQLAEAKPRDPSALYELGATVGLIASYRASVQGEVLDALRAARRAYDAHTRVLELDPERHDASLVAGTYRYLVSLLPWALRVMAYLAGFDGGKTEGLRLNEEAAAYPGESQAEARFTLLLMDNRERRFGEARRILHQLQSRYPRNRLLWLVEGSTALRSRHGDRYPARHSHARGRSAPPRGRRAGALAPEAWYGQRVAG